MKTNIVTATVYFKAIAEQGTDKSEIERTIEMSAPEALGGPIANEGITREDYCKQVGDYAVNKLSDKLAFFDMVLLVHRVVSVNNIDAEGVFKYVTEDGVRRAYSN